MKTRRGVTKRRRGRGLSLVEVVVSILLVGMLLIGALRCLGGTLRSRSFNTHMVRGKQLAQQLMVEILSSAYEEPDDKSKFGRDSSESGGDRQEWDDVDDYHGWSESPPEQKNGTEMTYLPGWRRDVTVEWVTWEDPSVVTASESGVKRVTVTVRYNDAILAREVGLRSDKYVTP